MAFYLKTLLTIALVAAAQIYSANGAPPPTGSDRLDAPLSNTDRLLSLEEFGKFIGMFDQQVKNVLNAQAATKIKNKNVTEAHKKFQKTYKEFNKKKANITKEDLAKLLKQIDAMADSLVDGATAAAATVRLEVPYSFKVELDDGSNKTTTYFEQYFKKKLSAMNDLFAKEKGNLTMQTRLKKVDPELFEKVYEKLLSIAAYISIISDDRKSNIEEFFKNYESTEVANELAEKCKETVDENKEANEEAFDRTDAISKLYCGCLFGSIPGFLCCAPAFPLFCAACTVTLCAEGLQISKLDTKQKAKLNEMYALVKTHTWKPKKKPVGGRGGRIGN